MNFLRTFPDSKTLLTLYPGVEILQVNAHVHTPYSFSAFTDIPQIFDMARKENLAAVGINDFFVTDGYEAFYHEALKAGIFPLFNIEFIGLLKKEQKEGIRINDPGNPGRCYFCGKGLHYPFTLNNTLKGKLDGVVEESQHQVRSMIDKANHWFTRVNAGFNLDYNEIRRTYAKNLVRERHIAKAIRVAVFENASYDSSRIELLNRIFGDRPLKSSLSDMSGLENEIRNNLLKAGSQAFVEENDAAFLSIEEIMDLINHAGGIPCYPVLLDDKNGNFTEFEKDPESLWRELQAKNIGCIELIPGRNDGESLEIFVRFFRHKGFVILFGTEHNTPELLPLTCQTRGNKALSDTLMRTSYEGACVIAAHQYLVANNHPGFINHSGMPDNDTRETFVKLGNAVIHYFGKQYKTAENE